MFIENSAVNQIEPNAAKHWVFCLISVFKPHFMGENILFGAEFDSSTFRKGANDVVNSMDLMVNKQKELQVQFDTTGARLEEVQRELKDTSTQYNNLDKSSKDYVNTSIKLLEQIYALEKQVGTLRGVQKGEGQELDALKVKMDAVRGSVEQVTNEQKKLLGVFGQKISPEIDLSTLNGVGVKLQQLKGNFEKAFTPGLLNEMFDPKQIDLLTQHVAQGKGEFEQFNRIIEALGASLITIEPGTQAFEDLTAVIRAGKSVVAEYTKLYRDATTAVDESEPKYKSVRVRLQELRNELTRLEEAGKEETAEFKQVQLAAARLTDQYGDMQQQIRILASDTKYLDFGVEAINAVGAGLQIAMGAMELFGLSGEEAAKAQAKLLAIMNLVQGVQQLQNLLLKEGTILTVGAEIATKAYAASNAFLAASFGAAATAGTALKGVLITTGIGALVVAIGYLISKLIEWSDATDQVTAAQERLQKQLDHTEEFLKGDLAIIDRYSALRTEKLKQRGFSETAIFEETQKANAAKLNLYNQTLNQLQAQHDAADIDGRIKISETMQKVMDERKKFIIDNELDTEKERTKISEESRKKQKEAHDKFLQAEKAANALLEQIRLELSQRGKSDEEKELLKLKQDHDKRLEVLKKAGKDSADLERLYSGQVMDVKDNYRKMRTDAERELMNELSAIDFEASEKRIANIADEFEREREMIRLENEKGKAELQDRQTALLNQALEQRTQGNLTPAQYTTAISEINSTFDKLFDDLEEKMAIRSKELAAKRIQDLISTLNTDITLQSNNISIGASEEIKLQSELFIQGKINYEDYQKALNEIAYRRGQERIEITRQNLQAELKIITDRLAQGPANLLPDEIKALVSQQSDIERQLSELDVQQQGATVERHKKIEDEHAAHLQKTLQLYSSFAQVVGGFFKDIEMAEARRLDRSISLQEKRVANAKELAEKGNAQYLELEQKRLDELQRKREENARKQLAIDNALRLSQATVAAVSAIATAAGTGNPFLIIGAAVAVLAAIGAAYSMVNQLQAPSAEFYEGTTFVHGKEGRDKIPAKLTRGEAIIPAGTNAKYSETVNAIYNNTVPAEVLNYFVKAYPTTQFPIVDYSRIGNATDRFFSEKGHTDTNNKLDKLNQTLFMVVDKLENLDSVSLSLDQEGFSVSLIRAVRSEQMKWRM